MRKATFALLAVVALFAAGSSAFVVASKEQVKLEETKRKTLQDESVKSARWTEQNSAETPPISVGPIDSLPTLITNSERKITGTSSDSTQVPPWAIVTICALAVVDVASIEAVIFVLLRYRPRIKPPVSQMNVEASGQTQSAASCAEGKCAFSQLLRLSDDSNRLGYRTVPIAGYINPTQWLRVVVSMAQSKSTPIAVLVDSVGGATRAGIRLAEDLHQIAKKIQLWGIVTSECASASTFAWWACTDRYAIDLATIMHHAAFVETTLFPGSAQTLANTVVIDRKT